MNIRQRRSLAKYVASIAAEFGLRDWTFDFPNGPCSDHALAEVDCTYGRKRAAIRFSTDWMGLSPEEQRHVVVHELIHVHFAQANQAARDGFEALGRDAGKIANDAYSVGHEYGVDGLADAIDSHFPLWEG